MVTKTHYEQWLWRQWEMQRKSWAIECFCPHLFPIAATGAKTREQAADQIMRMIRMTVVQFATFNEDDLERLNRLVWSNGIRHLGPVDRN